MVENWGSTPDGQDILRVTIRNGGLTVRALSYGATLQDIRLAGHDYPLILGYPEPAPYVQNPCYFGSTVGRVANRIALGRTTLNGQTLHLPCNSQGHHLHGGPDGLSHRHWTLLDHGADYAVFQDRLPAGHMGYPGQLTVTAQFTVTAAAALDVTLTAQTDAPTLCNLTVHPYFHLDHTADLAQHRLQVLAPRFVEVDAHGIPTGRTPQVVGSNLDFTAPEPLVRHDRLIAVDHNFCLSEDRRALAPAAVLSSNASGLCLRVSTTMPGLQVYSMARPTTPECPVAPGAKTRTGLALEPQLWPDAPNHDHFPSASLTPDETYTHHTVFGFSQL